MGGPGMPEGGPGRTRGPERAQWPRRDWEGFSTRES
jgi:hypothetical protein